MVKYEGNKNSHVLLLKQKTEVNFVDAFVLAMAYFLRKYGNPFLLFSRNLMI